MFHNITIISSYFRKYLMKIISGIRSAQISNCASPNYSRKSRNPCDFILHTMDDMLRQPGTKRENFALLLTDSARYMSFAGKTLKELYPSLMHVTCIAHLLHNCATRVRAYLKNIDDVVATIKNKDRKKRCL